jgi:hypothetical protein
MCFGGRHFLNGRHIPTILETPTIRKGAYGSRA